MSPQMLWWRLLSWWSLLVKALRQIVRSACDEARML
jgi:hypothetical protein